MLVIIICFTKNKKRGRPKPSPLGGAGRSTLARCMWRHLERVVAVEREHRVLRLSEMMARGRCAFIALPKNLLLFSVGPCLI